MNQMTDLDKMINFDDKLKDMEKDEDTVPNDDENLKGSKKAMGDLDRILNFYGDMDKPNNERKIENQQISAGERDW